MWYEGAAKLWFFLFLICLAGAIVASYLYVQEKTDAGQTASAYETLKNSSAATEEKYNAVLAQYGTLSTDYTRLLGDHIKTANDYGEVINKYNQLVESYNVLAAE